MEYIASCKYRHPSIGIINVKVVATARSIRARWDGAILLITVPQALPLKKYEDFLEDNLEKILEMKPAPQFHIGQVIDGGEIDFMILENNIPGNRGGILCNVSCEGLRAGKEYNLILNIPTMLASNIEAPEVQTHIAKVLLRMAEKATVEFIIPHAVKLAGELGCTPTEWFVKHKKRSLGTCDGKGRICLNPRLIFLPQHLRDFVILHELAHLSEMNHSAAFHDICNRYCGGHEKELNAALKAFKFPVS